MIERRKDMTKKEEITQRKEILHQEIMMWPMMLKGLRPMPKLTLMSLTTLVNPDTLRTVCPTGLKRIAGMMNCNVKTARKAIRKLEDLGFVTVHLIPPGASDYSLNSEKIRASIPPAEYERVDWMPESEFYGKRTREEVIRDIEEEEFHYNHDCKRRA